MIPVFGTAAVLVAPAAPLLAAGYVAGNSLAAQNYNWLWYHITKELNNLLTVAGISQNTTVDTQVATAVQTIARLAVVNVSAGGSTAIGVISADTIIKANNATPATIDISAGASFTGCRLYISEVNATGVTIYTGVGMTAFLPYGDLHLLWNGAQWEKVGGVAFSQIFTSGSAATWKTPWAGVYKVTAVGGGGAGGGPAFGNSTGGGGGAGGSTAIKWFTELAAATFTYTVGTGGTASAGGAGGAGNNTTVSDGSITITGSGGNGGAIVSPASGGLAVAPTNGDLNIFGSDGGPGFPTASSMISGGGGNSFMGGGGGGTPSLNTVITGKAGHNFGGGGGGGLAAAAGTSTGGAGAPGVVVIEF